MAAADTNDSDVAAQYFATGTDGNYIVTVTATYERGSGWRIVNLDSAMTPYASAPPESTSPTSGRTDAPTTDAAGSVTVQSSEGKRITVNLQLTKPVSDATSAATANWKSHLGQGAIPCVTDSSTDGVIVGTQSFHNETPSYTPTVYLNWLDIKTGGALAFGVGYSSGNQCVTAGSDVWEGSAVQPNWTSASWARFRSCS